MNDVVPPGLTRFSQGWSVVSRLLESVHEGGQRAFAGRERVVLQCR